MQPINRTTIFLEQKLREYLGKKAKITRERHTVWKSHGTKIGKITIEPLQKERIPEAWKEKIRDAVMKIVEKGSVALVEYHNKRVLIIVTEPKCFN